MRIKGWREFIARVHSRSEAETLAHGGYSRYEIDIYRDVSESILPPTSRLRRWVHATKDALAVRLRESRLTTSWLITAQYGLWDRRAARRLLRKVKPFALPDELLFVGDLDPLDLHAFLTMRESLQSIALSLHVRLAGVDSRWLLGRGRLDDCLIRLDMDERQHLKLLETFIDLDSLVGPEASALLRGGHKLEVQGAVGILGPRWRTKVIRLIEAC